MCSTSSSSKVNLFRGRSPQDRWQRVFGGQVIGQALVAATRTVEGRSPHSLHAYFLIGGDPKVPIIYEVDRIRDGKSFTTRRVVAIQHGQAIFTLMVSFHNDEPGLEHQAQMPEVPPPEELPSEAQIRATVLPRMPEAVQRYYQSERPIELRPVEYRRYLGKKSEDGKFNVWIRTTGKLPDDPGDPPMRARLCVRHVAARRRAGAARAQPVRERLHGREPRSCALAAPSVPRR
jgi:acyl-CoA thioesterase-2